jgi:23S rRNA A2030 N6-methylase RlmJ
MADQRRNAGNIGDVIKHALLPQLALGFDSRQTATWTYCETHAGYYDYPLTLLKDGQCWKGERAWSIGVVQRSGRMNELGRYGTELARSFEAGVYPGSMRIIDSALAASRLDRLVGWDIGAEQVDSYVSKSARIVVERGDGYNSVTSLQAESRLVFCDPFWTEAAETEKAKSLVSRENAAIVWYPLSANARSFREWAAQQPYPSLEIRYRCWRANKNGWAGQDMQGAGLLIKGLPDEAIQGALSISRVLQSIFEGQRVEGRNRAGKAGSTVAPGVRDLSLRVTFSW